MTQYSSSYASSLQVLQVHCSYLRSARSITSTWEQCQNCSSRAMSSGMFGNLSHKSVKCSYFLGFSRRHLYWSCLLSRSSNGLRCDQAPFVLSSMVVHCLYIRYDFFVKYPVHLRDFLSLGITGLLL